MGDFIKRKFQKDYIPTLNKLSTFKHVNLLTKSMCTIVNNWWF